MHYLCVREIMLIICSAAAVTISKHWTTVNSELLVVVFFLKFAIPFLLRGTGNSNAAWSRLQRFKYFCTSDKQLLFSTISAHFRPV